MQQGSRTIPQKSMGLRLRLGNRGLILPGPPKKQRECLPEKCTPRMGGVGVCPLVLTTNKDLRLSNKLKVYSGASKDSNLKDTIQVATQAGL